MESPTQAPTTPSTTPPDQKKRNAVYVRWFIIIALLMVVIVYYVMDKRKKNEAIVEQDNSFAEVIPGMDGENMFLFVRNHGATALKKVKVALRDAANVSPTLDDMVEVGNIPPHGEQRTGIPMVPKIDPNTVNKDEKGEPMDVRYIIIKTSDTVYTEVIEFKPGTCSPWVARYLVDRNASGGQPTKRVRVMNWSTETCAEHPTEDHSSAVHSSVERASGQSPVVRPSSTQQPLMGLPPYAIQKQDTPTVQLKMLAPGAPVPRHKDVAPTTQGQ